MYLLNVMRQLLRQVVRHVTILNYVILFCLASSEPLALDPLCILVFLPRSFDFNADVNSMYSADKSTNDIFT